MGSWRGQEGLAMASQLPGFSSCCRVTMVDIISVYGLNVAAALCRALLTFMHCPLGLVRWPVDGCQQV